MKEKVFVVIPGHNESKHVASVIKDAKNRGFQNILFVDDGSKDDSSKKAKEAGAIVLRHKINLGKGAAVKTGCDYALKEKADIVCLMDSDGQHKARDLKRLLDKLIKTKSDIAFGYRSLNKNMPLVTKFGNWFINTTTKLIQGIKLRDTQSGMRCFTRKAYKKLRWTANDYSMESEMIANAAKNRLKYTEEKIDTVYLDSFKGTTVLDGIKIVINIFKYRLIR